MSSILVLLALLSVATLAARRGYVGFVIHIITTPILLAAGYLLSPKNLGVFRPSMLDDLTPAMRVGAAWLALLLGMRGIRPVMNKEYVVDALFSIIVSAFTWFALSGFCYGAFLLFDQVGLSFAPESLQMRGSAFQSVVELPKVGASLLIGGLLASTGLHFAREALQHVTPSRQTERVLFLARHDDLVCAIALCVAIFLWPVASEVAPIYEAPGLASGLVVGFGLLFAVVFLLHTGNNTGGGLEGLTIALLGLVILTAGISTATRLPEAPIAFFMGTLLGILGLGKRHLDAGLVVTERQVRIALLVLIGVQLKLSVGPIVLGLSLGLCRFGLKALIRALFFPGNQIPLGALVGASTTCLAFALSFSLTRPADTLVNNMLCTVAVAVAVADLLALVVWRRSDSDAYIQANDSLGPMTLSEEVSA